MASSTPVRSGYRPGKKRCSGRYSERTGVEEAYVGDLRNRHLTPVVVHRDVVEQPRVRAARADLGQVCFQGVERLVHSLLGVLLDVGQGIHESPSSRSQALT